MIQRIKTNGIEMDVLEFFKDERLSNFDCKRIFTLKNMPYNCERGKHAHYECVQVLHVVNGSIKLNQWYYDVVSKKLTNFVTSVNKSEYRIVRPMTWLEIISTDNYTDLIVYCNMIYNENDYIRDFDTYVKEIKKIHNNNCDMLIK